MSSNIEATYSVVYQQVLNSRGDNCPYIFKNGWCCLCTFGFPCVNIYKKSFVHIATFSTALVVYVPMRISYKYILHCAMCCLAASNENVWISLKISLKFVSWVRIDNIPSLVQIMAWRQPGDKPSSESRMISLLTHICVTRPHWVNMSRNHNELRWKNSKIT